MTSDKFIICFAQVILEIYLKLRENIAILGQKVLDVRWHVIPAQRVKREKQIDDGHCFTFIKIIS